MNARDLKTIRVIAFPGAPNLPTYAAIENGFFAQEGLAIDLSITPSSVFQAEQVAAGNFEIAFTAFDNVVAYGEGQGAAPVDPQYRVVMGATQLELALVAAPDVTDVPALKGRTVALDALTTGFAFALFDMMAKAGVARDDVSFVAVGATPQRWQSVKSGEHAATLTIEPFTSIAERSGYRVLDLSTRHYSAYQGGVVAANAGLLEGNRDAVEAFVRAYLAGLAWTLDAANREKAEALLVSRMPEIQPAAVPAVMRSLLSPASGLTPAAAILPDGMQRVLDLRSRYGGGVEPLRDHEKYVDRRAYDYAQAHGS